MAPRTSTLFGLSGMTLFGLSGMTLITTTLAFQPKPPTLPSENVTAFSRQMLEHLGLDPEDMDLTDDLDTHGVFFALGHMGHVLAADEKLEEPKLAGARRRLDGSSSADRISDTYCQDMNINPDTVPTGPAWDYTGTTPTKPCTEGLTAEDGNCKLTGSIFKMGENAVSFADEAGRLEYFVAWGWTDNGNTGSWGLNWAYWVATCFYATYEPGFAINKEKEDYDFGGVSTGKVSCEDCFVDTSAKVTIAFKYMSNSKKTGSYGSSGYEDYEILTSLNGNLDYNLDFKMEAPTFSLSSWDTVQMKAMTPISIPVYTGVTVGVEGSGDLLLKGDAELTGGSVEITASLDTNLDAYGKKERDEDFDFGMETSVNYKPLSIATTALELSSKKNDVEVGFKPKFPITIAASLGKYGPLELKAELIVDVDFAIEARMQDANCQTTYLADTILGYGIKMLGSDILEGDAMKLPNFIQGEGKFCIAEAKGDFTDTQSGQTVGPGQTVGESGSGDDDDDDELSEGAIAGIVIAVIIVFCACAAAAVYYFMGAETIAETIAEPIVAFAKPGDKVQDPEKQDIHDAEVELQEY